MTDRPNVLLIILDSVRAANTSLHGYHRETTPYLERLVANSAIGFDQARSPGTTSITSHTSMLTGLHVREHGLTSEAGDCKLVGTDSVFERLQSEYEYTTGVFSNNPYLTELDVGLRDRFGTLVGRREELPFPEGVNVKNFLIDSGDGTPYLSFLKEAVGSDRPIGSLVNGLSFKLAGTAWENRLPAKFRLDGSARVYLDAFLEWEADQQAPWAVCCNLMDAHFPYNPGEHNQWGDDALLRKQGRVHDETTFPWTFLTNDAALEDLRALEPLYDGAIRHLDAAVERLVEELTRRETLDNTFLIITADHGEGFGELSTVSDGARYIGHGNGGVGEVLTHVPLVVRPPEGAATPKRFGAPASLTNIPSVIHSLVAETEGDAIREFNDGPIIASAAGIDEDAAETAQGFGADPVPYSQPADAVYVGNSNTVRKHTRWGPDTQAMDIPNAQESHAIGPADETVLDAIRTLESANVTTSTTTEPSAVVEERLADLGYR